MTIKIILVLTTPVHGYAIIQEIDKLSDGSVKVAAGTMYGAIENLLKLNLIEEIPSRPQRRKEGKNPFKRFLPSLRR
ncbi:helix-turn-helix transcriptional regulator [Listeria innocua]|nr:helix-turn-helix transcriptional regulator [Listeria innocua]EKA7756765.1 helix-turn-helix transcriptional regulator [Listeria innocua]EKA7762882.1 helix-turn-helix transcriptional regulator [Listeria innocua]EKA7765999.1 helix-turn-helix transcriptional regulator [Listeria innocua]EKA7769156.1 helix-turn-helix transcriptional regulator [Listeria innocua]